LSVWLERPPSTGVASTIHPSSLPRAVSVAMAPMAWPISPCHPAQALGAASLPGQGGEPVPQAAVAMTSQPASEVTPSRAWMTARVTGSASDTWGAIPTGGRHGAS